MLSEYNGDDDVDIVCDKAAKGVEAKSDFISDDSTNADSDLDEASIARWTSNGIFSSSSEGSSTAQSSPLLTCLQPSMSSDESFMETLTCEFVDAFNKPDFKLDLQTLLREGAGPDASNQLNAVVGREELCLAALQEVLPDYGYRCTPEDLEIVLCLLEDTAIDYEPIKARMIEIYDCLGLAPRTAFGTVPWAV